MQSTVFRLQDLILLLAVFTSILFGILFPQACPVFRPMPLYCLMILFFLSYLPIKMDVFLANIASSAKSIATLSFLKLVLLPVAVFYLVHWSLPNYAAAAFLLAAISTGVTAPFIAGLVGANSGLVLSVVVATSLLVPFTMPVLTKILLSRSSGISLGEMVKTLVLIVFIPVLFAELVEKEVAGVRRRDHEGPVSGLRGPVCPDQPRGVLPVWGILLPGSFRSAGCGPIRRFPGACLFPRRGPGYEGKASRGPTCRGRDLWKYQQRNDPCFRLPFFRAHRDDRSGHVQYPVFRIDHSHADIPGLAVEAHRKRSRARSPAVTGKAKKILHHAWPRKVAASDNLLDIPPLFYKS